MSGDQDRGPTYRVALRHPVVRNLWLATAVSVVGDYIGLSALMLVAHARSGLILGAAAIFAVGALPGLLSGVFAGSWLDQLPRGRALVGLQLFGALAVSLPLVLPGLIPVFVAAALLGAIRTAVVSVRSGAMAEGVPDDLRGPLIAMLSTTEQASQIIGFGAGTSLVLWVGASTALLADTVSFLAGAWLLSRITFPRPQVRARPPVTAGLKDIWANPVLRLLAPLVCITAMVGALPEALAAGAAGQSGWAPIVFAAAPAGQALTMIVLGRLKQLGRPSVQLTHLAWLALAFGIAALGRTPAWFAVSNFLVGSGAAWIIGPQLLFVRLAPAERMAQITGTMVAVLIAAEGLGTPLFAALADRATVSSAYWLAGVVVLLTSLVGWFLKERTPAALALDEDPAPASGA